ncbi:MAG: outer membrane beta-barrel protein [Gammaproteobacteria bacterium]
MIYHKYAAPVAALAAAWLLPTTAMTADSLAFNYLEVDYVNVDVDFSESFLVDADTTFRQRTSSDGGYRIGGAWEFYDRFHVFAEFSSADQDLRATLNGVSAGKDNFDVERLRLGLGYSLPLSNVNSVYGRVSFDRTEFSTRGVSTQTLSTRTSDEGLGVEVGTLWNAAQNLQLQGHLRYTEVGELNAGARNSFNDDVLVGVSGRWFLRDRFALQAGYEVGEIDTWNVGARYTF